MFAALLLALGAVACSSRRLPTTYVRDYDKERLVTTGSDALVGLVFLATSLSASAFFVTGLVFGDPAAVVTVLAMERGACPLTLSRRRD